MKIDVTSQSQRFNQSAFAPAGKEQRGQTPDAGETPERPLNYKARAAVAADIIRSLDAQKAEQQPSKADVIAFHDAAVYPPGSRGARTRMKDIINLFSGRSTLLHHFWADEMANHNIHA